MKASFFSQIKNIASQLPDNIFIIGKGASIDHLNLDGIQNYGFVINLNDSERIIPGHLSIFKAEWAFESIKDNKFKSEMYLTCTSHAEYKNFFIIDAAPQTQFSNDLLLSRLGDDEILIEEPLFITAFKICKIIQELASTKQKIYMLGFDFNPNSGYSSKIEDFSTNQYEFSDYLISSQEEYLKVLLNFFDPKVLSIKHVGSKDYSSLNFKNFNSLFASDSSSQSKKVSHHKNLFKKYEEIVESDKVIVTAEFTTNHFGSIDKLEAMVKKAKLDGADFVKVQKRNVEKFYTSEQLESRYDSPFGKTFRDYRNQLELSDEDFFKLDEICTHLEIPWFLSVLDETSFNFLEKLPIPVIKLPSTISNFTTFLKAVSDSYNGDVIISTGMTDQKYEKFVIDNFSSNSRLFLLQCNSAYPTPPQDCNIAVISRYASLSNNNINIVPGYSSHDVGSFASCLAVAAGAKMIEKHVKYGNTDWAHFDSVALDLTTDEFAKFVSDIRYSETIYGNEKKVINSSEHHKY